MEFLKQVYWNNTLLDYAIFLLALTLSVAAIFVLGRVLLRKIAAYNEKTPTPYGDLIVASINNILGQLPISRRFTIARGCSHSI